MCHCFTCPKHYYLRFFNLIEWISEWVNELVIAVSWLNTPGQTWGQFNSGIDYLKKNELELRNFELELRNFELELRNFEFEVSYKNLYPKINLPFYNVNTYNLHVVLPIYWNHNDPELWFFIYIYIYKICTPTVAPQVSIEPIKMVWVTWAPPPLWH